MSGKAGGRVGSINNNGKGNNNGISGIPAGSRKMVQSLKEIVNCPELEIYAMLKECNMDPNEAVNRLLSQDSFHEVKRKREKKKESKEIDPRSQGANNMMHHGGRGGTDLYGHGGVTQFSSNDSGASHGIPAYKENGTPAYAGSSFSASTLVGNNQRPPLHSDAAATENKTSIIGTGGVSSSSQTSGSLSIWLGIPGQVSMADIVKKGRPHNKAPVLSPHHSINHHHGSEPPLAASHHELHSSENHTSKSEINTQTEIAASDDEWPSEQPPDAAVSSVLDVPAESELYTDQSKLSLDGSNQHMESQLNDIESEKDDHNETLSGRHVVSASSSSRNVQEDGSGGASLFDDNLYVNMNSYQPHRHAFEHNEAEDGTSSVAASIQQLSLENDDLGAPHEEDNHSVIIPNHLQVHAQECSHLSFGSFGSGINSSFSGPFASMPMKNNLEEMSEVVDASLVGHSDARNPEYYGDDHLRSSSDENLVCRASLNAGNYDSPSVPQLEVLKEETPEPVQGNRHPFPSSAPGYAYDDNTRQLNGSFNNPQTSSQMQNISPFSSVMAYTNSLPSTLLASTVPTGREPDLPYSPFSVTQSVPTQYSDTASLINGPSVSMPEALRAGGISTQPTQHVLPSPNVATGPALPQHLAVHPYAQPTLPLGHFANMISYPFLPQSYTYMPSALQQTFAGNNTYHQSLAAVLPQFKNNVSVSSLPQPAAAVASGYGFGSSTSIPAGNFPLNPATTPAGTTIGYDNVLSSQYKDGNHLISLQQNENSTMWVHGPGSRTVSAVPASTHYSFQGQNQQQPGGFRQGQQPSQHFGALGYPNYYQTGMSLEHQQQNSRDGSHSATQGQPSKQAAQQLWQNSY